MFSILHQFIYPIRLFFISLGSFDWDFRWCGSGSHMLVLARWPFPSPRRPAAGRNSDDWQQELTLPPGARSAPSTQCPRTTSRCPALLGLCCQGRQPLRLHGFAVSAREKRNSRAANWLGRPPCFLLRLATMNISTSVAMYRAPSLFALEEQHRRYNTLSASPPVTSKKSATPALGPRALPRHCTSARTASWPRVDVAWTRTATSWSSALPS
jgi:hypothetical protein